MASADHYITGKRVGGNYTQLFLWHRPADDESLLPIVSSLFNITILSIMNATIAGLPNPSWTIRELGCCQEEPNGDGGLHSWNITPIFDNNTVAGSVLAAIKLPKPRLLCVIDHGQQANSISGGQSPIHAARSYLSLDDILPPPANDIVNHIWEESDNDVETWHPNALWVCIDWTLWRVDRWVIRGCFSVRVWVSFGDLFILLLH